MLPSPALRTCAYSLNLEHIVAHCQLSRFLARGKERRKHRTVYRMQGGGSGHVGEGVAAVSDQPGGRKHVAAVARQRFIAVFIQGGLLTPPGTTTQLTVCDRGSAGGKNRGRDLLEVRCPFEPEVNGGSAAKVAGHGINTVSQCHSSSGSSCYRVPCLGLLGVVRVLPSPPSSFPARSPLFSRPGGGFLGGQG